MILTPRFCSFLKASQIFGSLLLISICGSAWGQDTGFSSGSDGSMGALHVTESTTLDMPEDGVFHYTTITIDSGVTLRFNKNQANTPVYMLATGHIQIEGTIDISGGRPESGPGGFNGGNPYGPGYGPHGSDSNQSITPINNSLLIPLYGGSGSASSNGYIGYGGGGAILIASSASILFSGVIRSNSTAQRGTVRFVTPEMETIGGTVGGISRGSVIASKCRIDTLRKVGTFYYWLQRAPGYCNPSVGSFMYTGLEPELQAALPQLNIVSIGEQPVDAAQTFISLPINTTTDLDVQITTTNVSDGSRVRVILIPMQGVRSTFEGTVANSAVTVPVSFTPNMGTQVLVTLAPPAE